LELIAEYLNQQAWRNWAYYLKLLPIKNTDHVLDLGCSVGGFLRLASQHCASTVGVDLNPEFIAHCQQHKAQNQTFICADIQSLGLPMFQTVNGVWCSFSLSYLKNPDVYLARIFSYLPPGAWIGVLDVDCFVSGNLPVDSPFYEQVRTFELASHQRGAYDFALGHKLKACLSGAGFELIHFNPDVTDLELNFDGRARPEVWQNWKARLKRLPGLQKTLGPAAYQEMSQELLAFLQSEQHSQRHNLCFAIGLKANS